MLNTGLDDVETAIKFNDISFDKLQFVESGRLHEFIAF